MRHLIWTKDDVIQRVSPLDLDPDFGNVPADALGVVVATEPGQPLGDAIVWRVDGELFNIGVLAIDQPEGAVQSVEAIVVLSDGGVGVAEMNG